MSHRDIDLTALRATIAKVGYPFHTKDVSGHPDMLRAHPELAAERNYHAWVGRCISESIDEARQERPSNRRGARWVRRDVQDTAPAVSAPDRVSPPTRASDLGPQFPGDNPFARQMRRHQSWYHARVLGLPCGTGPTAKDTSSLGNMLTAEDGARGMNFLTPEIHEVARERLREGQGTVEEYRLLHNLLSSQPMCFNLFGPLVRDHALATLLWRALLGDEVAAVTRVRIEYAPLPAAEYLDDRTAFDAFVEYRRPDGALCFTGVETKLTEPFSQSGDYSQAQRRYQRWLEGAELPWRPERLSAVDAKEHNQLWRDHLLAFAMVKHPRSSYAAGRLLLVRHDGDRRCEQTVARYRGLLRPDDDTFIDQPLSRLVAAWEGAVAQQGLEDRVAWLAAFRRRYLSLHESGSGALP